MMLAKFSIAGSAVIADLRGELQNASRFCVFQSVSLNLCNLGTEGVKLKTVQTLGNSCRLALGQSPWNSVGLRGTPWNSVELHETPWNSVELRGIFRELRGTPWECGVLRGTPWENGSCMAQNNSVVSGFAWGKGTWQSSLGLKFLHHRAKIGKQIVSRVQIAAAANNTLTQYLNTPTSHFSPGESPTSTDPSQKDPSVLAEPDRVT